MTYNFKNTNGHGHHVLDIRDTPKNFLGVISAFIYGNPEKRAKMIEGILKKTPGQKAKYLAGYLDTIDNTDEERLLEDLKYHKEVVCICTDLHYMGAGKCKRDFEDQIISAVRLKKKYPGKVKVFVMLDPNRTGLYGMAKRWHSHIDGWKLYPTWYYVTDYRLRYVLNDFPLPIIVHCTDTSPVHWEGSRSELKKRLGENVDLYRWYKSKQWNCQFFSHPKYIHLMSCLYPNINWCCAHLGGKNKERQDFIIERLGGNFFADDSFTFTDEHEAENLIPILEHYENINHGTDYFMTKTKTEYVNQIEVYNRMIPQDLKEKQEESLSRFLKRL